MINKAVNLNKGTLYIVGTPIGNLKDITLRAIETLNLVDIVLAEDTRHTLKLLNHLNISKRLVSYHKHNEVDKISHVINMLDEGNNIALVSDAGMPVISDPGENLITVLIEKKYNVVVIPGVTAVTTAIVKSKIDSSRFAFEGFLSVNKKQRKTRLKSLVDETRTIIFYEAPHKLIYTLKDLYEYLGNRNICIARELTKIHEEYIHTNLKEAVDKFESEPLKGEIVLIVEGRSEVELINSELESIANISNVQLVKDYILAGIDKKEAIKKVAKLKNLSKNEVYKECIDL
ncbi:MAG: 16S rRNA (cytidine(1402)-2'-O)-methyltransferase [Clostridia bacterium]|nr:16S rRNA (cytidine(1402)-2'-O)-methyltransferase [Clostridia bacterium]